MSKVLPIQDIEGHKGNFGKVLVITRSRGVSDVAYNDFIENISGFMKRLLEKR